MIFSNDKAIYVQIAERLSDEILAGKYKEDERIPSVREYAVLLEVNANTAVKAYDLLATDEIIYNKRGLGYFVSAGAKKQIKKTRKKEFMKERLPELARQMQLLDISSFPDDECRQYPHHGDCYAYRRLRAVYIELLHDSRLPCKHHRKFSKSNIQSRNRCR